LHLSTLGVWRLRDLGLGIRLSRSQCGQLLGNNSSGRIGSLRRYRRQRIGGRWQPDRYSQLPLTTVVLTSTPTLFVGIALTVQTKHLQMFKPQEICPTPTPFGRDYPLLTHAPPPCTTLYMHQLMTTIRTMKKAPMAYWHFRASQGSSLSDLHCRPYTSIGTSSSSWCVGHLMRWGIKHGPHRLYNHPSQIFVSHDRKFLPHTFQASCCSDRHLWATIQIFNNRHCYIIQISLHTYLRLP
jgi:hypothetical protein